MPLIKCLRHSGLKDHIQAILYLRKKKQRKTTLALHIAFLQLRKKHTQQKESIWRPMTSVHSTILLDSWTQIEIVT